MSVEELQVDFLTIVGHKFYGPRVGALYARVPIRPMMYGGGQEQGFRAGTENTPMIAGMHILLSLQAFYPTSHLSGLGVAAEMAETMSPEVRDHFEKLLVNQLGGKVQINCGSAPYRLPNTSNFAIRGTRLGRRNMYKRNNVIKYNEVTEANVFIYTVSKL